MKVTVLCNDVAKEGFFHEHGLSLLIENETLFDTGTSDVAVKNAELLGIDLSKVKRIFISHGHYDHMGGLPYVLDKTGKVDLYVHKKALIPKYSGNRFAGISYDWKIVEENARVHLIENDVFVEGFYLINDVPTEEKNIDPNFLVNGKHDLFEDEINLYKDGVLISGCAHRGIDNILKVTSKSHKVHTVVGGFHLKDSPLQRIEEVLNVFKAYNVKVVPMHCTGENAIEIFKKSLDKCVIARAGDVLEL